MISHEHRCIYVHIPKTAGTSIEAKLGHAGEPDHRRIVELEPYDFRAFLGRARRAGLAGRALGTAWHEYRHQALTREQYRSYFKFAFVRNPWDRVLSWYRNVMRDKMHRRKDSPSRPPGRSVPDDCTLKQFVIEFGTDFSLRPQLWWLRDSRGGLALDFIGRFESLDTDFGHVCDQLGIADRSLPRSNVARGTEGTAEFDSEVIDVIYERYKEEIRLFGYHFDPVANTP